MKTAVRVILATSALGIGLVGFASPASAKPADKVTICHGTSSDTNPHVVITISENALKAHLGDGGKGHSADPGPPGPKNDDFGPSARSRDTAKPADDRSDAPRRVSG